MSESRTTPIIAVDGGGTRCRVAFADGQKVHAVETGSANVSTDFDGGVREILSGLDRLAAEMDTPLQALCQHAAFVGLAGVTGSEIADRLKQALPFRDAKIADDRPAALRGALGEADGLLAHCGTGSFFGVQTGRAQKFVGGWGPILGDEASAQWIGRAALTATLDRVDGLSDQTGLSEALLSEFGGSAGIVRFATNASPTQFGALARQVTEAEDRGDPMARDVMRRGADIIAAILSQLGWRPGLQICLTGGIGPHFERHLPDDMRQSIVSPHGVPLDGAISLAMDFAREAEYEHS